MTKKYNLYLGKAGQFAAMSLFLKRGWNVATPEVDVGDDIFVVEDKKGIFYRVQVKTAQATKRNKTYSAQFNIPLKQLNAFIEPEIYYVFMVSDKGTDEWANALIVKRLTLVDLYRNQQVGSVSGDKLVLYFSFQGDKVACSNVDFSSFANNFEDFYFIDH
jgi:hypothetical protein